MQLRNSVLVLMCFTVIAPIVLYTDRLGTFKSWSSGYEFNEEISTSSSGGGDVGKLKLLPQEFLVAQKEPVGVVYTDNSASLSGSLEDSEMQKVVEHKSRVLYATDDVLQSQKENPIKQAIDNSHKGHQDGLLENPELNGEDENLEEKKIPVKLTPPVQTVNKATEEREVEYGQRSAQNSHKVDTSKLLKTQNVKQKDQMVPPDAHIQQLKDQLVRGRVYLSLAATRSNSQFIRELRLRMKEVQRVLVGAARDSELPRSAYAKIKAMEQTLARGRQIQDDCAAVVKKLRAILHSTEEQLRVHKKQTMFLTQLTAKTVPKGLHCFPLRLTSEYYSLDSSQRQFVGENKLDDPRLYHYAIFSDNILATAVVVNSTIFHAKDPSRHVFHIVTDRLNYAAMRMWFLSNPPGKAFIQVQNVEEFTWLNSSYSPVLEQLGSRSMIDYYFKAHRANSDSNLKFRNPKYLSILNHLRFYLPEIFPRLNKVLFLDDDIVVQKDLTGLWSIDLKGNVNGAVETCRESFHRFDRYLNFSNPLISKNFDPRACGWAYGMNIFDLEEWRRQNITEVYHSWQKLNQDRQLWKLGTLPPGLITFWKRTYPLDRSWHVLGLGYNPNVSQRDIERAAVIHYNGNLKPWLDIAIPKFRGYWSNNINYDHLYLRECNINP